MLSAERVISSSQGTGASGALGSELGTGVSGIRMHVAALGAKQLFKIFLNPPKKDVFSDPHRHPDEMNTEFGPFAE